MALCVLSAQWKINGLGDSRDGDGFIDGILAIVVDHGLRSESKDEAEMVSRRVSEMGITFYIDVDLNEVRNDMLVAKDD